MYTRWRRELPPWIDVRPVELPGRGSRASEALETTMEGLVDRAVQSVLPHARRPFALFGHSMGALLAYELAWRLTYQHELEPSIVFASGASAPSQRDSARFTRLKSDAEIVEELEELEGTPRAVFESAELIQLILPVLRADFAVCGRYQYRPRPKLRCPLQVIVGRDDATSAPESVQAWRAHTSGACDFSSLSGGHFFIHESRGPLLDLIRERLTQLASPLLPSQAGRADAEPQEMLDVAR